MHISRFTPFLYTYVRRRFENFFYVHHPVAVVAQRIERSSRVLIPIPSHEKEKARREEEAEDD
jgi:hypothetical protein